MAISEIIILGLTQGLTEFLPVSSSGHLLVARQWFEIAEFEGTAVDAVLHLGTLLAVLVYYWREWRDLLVSLVRRGEREKGNRQLIIKLIVATIPAAVVGWWWQDRIAGGRGETVLAAGFLFTAVTLWWSEKYSRRNQERERGGEKHQPSVTDAIVIGLAQVLALVPSISRSGVTMAAGMMRGMKREQAVNWSFLMSAPIIAGAGLASLWSLSDSGLSALTLLVGVITSFVSGLAAIYWLIKIIRQWSLIPFALYLVGLVILLYAT